MSKSDRLYKDSPSVGKDADGKAEVQTPAPTSGTENVGDDGSNAAMGDESHDAERASMHRRHEEEQKSMHERHGKDMKEMHKRHEKKEPKEEGKE